MRKVMDRLEDWVYEYLMEEQVLDNFFVAGGGLDGAKRDAEDFVSDPYGDYSELEFEFFPITISATVGSSIEKTVIRERVPKYDAQKKKCECCGQIL